MELDAHAVDGNTSVLHSRDHIENFVILAIAVHGTVVIVEKESIRVSFLSIFEGFVNVRVAVNVSLTAVWHIGPGMSNLQDVVRVAIISDSLVDDVPSEDLRISRGNPSADSVHDLEDVILEDCIELSSWDFLPLQPLWNDSWDLGGGSPDEGVSSELHVIVKCILESKDASGHVVFSSFPLLDDVHLAFILGHKDGVLLLEIVIISGVFCMVHVDG